MNALSSILGAVRFAVVLSVLCGLAYPLVTTAIGGALFPWQATGSLLVVDGTAVGSTLVGQPFVSDRYFYGRPSPCGHDPRGLAGSNQAASNPDLRVRVAADAQAVGSREGAEAADVPPELVAASGSCIDPEISVPAASLQAARVAAARGVAADAIQEQIRAHTVDAGPLALGTPRVNVLLLNLALDGTPTGHP